MNRNFQLIYIATALLAASSQGADAATVVRATGSSSLICPSPTTCVSGYAFDPVVNADQLVSVSTGVSVNSGEGSFTDNLTLSGIYSDSSIVPIETVAIGGTSYGFHNYPVTFTAAALSGGTLLGVTFSNSSGFYYETVVNSGTSFTFNVPDPATSAVPEPAIWAMMLTGFAAIGATLRRRHTKAVLLAS